MSRLERRDAILELALNSEPNYHELARFLEEERRRKLRKIRAWEWGALIVLNLFGALALVWRVVR
jgi:hypothetical protein